MELIAALWDLGMTDIFAGSLHSEGSSRDGIGTSATFCFCTPYFFGIAADSNGILFVTDTCGTSIRRIDSSSEGGSRILISTCGASVMTCPLNILVSTVAGNVTSFAGSSGDQGYFDGIGTAALFEAPADVAVDTFGNCFVADTAVNIIRRISTAGSFPLLGVLQGCSHNFILCCRDRQFVCWSPWNFSKSRWCWDQCSNGCSSSNSF